MQRTLRPRQRHSRAFVRPGCLPEHTASTAFRREEIRVYHVGPSPTKVLLGGAVALEAVAAGLFWSAMRHPGGARRWRALCHAVDVWVAFILATEVFVAHPSEAPFRELLLLRIATAIYFEVLVDHVPTALARGETMQGVSVPPSLERRLRKRQDRVLRPPMSVTRRVALGAVVVGVLCACTSVALAGTSVSLGVAKRTVSGKPQTIVVDGRGVTVYELGGKVSPTSSA